MTSALPAIEPMTPDEFRRLRESIGLTQEQLAHHIDRTLRTVATWETSDGPIDTVAALAIRKLVEDARGARKPKRARR